MNGPDRPAASRKVALGPALDTPEDELDMAALVTLEDTEAAKADAAARAGKRMKALLEAARVEAPDTADAAAPFVPSD